MNWASLTEDLQIEILVRLPRKSLMRFKSVQRSWNILFKTYSFVNKRMLHNSQNGKAHNLTILSLGKLVAEMSHDDVLAEIKSGMKKAKCAFDIKTEMRFLEDVLICKAELEKELAAEHQKVNFEFQKLRVALQMRIDKIRKLTATTDEAAGDKSVGVLE
ncbi:putative F-box domain, leucine-rich repeat domain, L domain-containing protein [Medicago truncatula]|uniref:Putative F-box domain, leucine-rich repeat domain, L domain-containing protein n=1 Tax=Medicago truncatula TaxID=3880 RepID=A0A396HQF4_MEDTR|nr:putative F-box domain, leucine-rich repeat domain, L domain-containing protein [Medicago truncatula]